MWQILKAMVFVHSHNIIHRDVKPENMLLSKNGVLKICDFGFARSAAKDKEFTGYVSTRWYRAPELLVGERNYGKAVDVWAIGCIFIELLTGRPLFTGNTDYETLKQVLQAFQGEEELPENLKQAFSRNQLFQGAQVPYPHDFDFDAGVESRLAFLENPLAVDFARECLRLDASQRPSCRELMTHAYFDGFRDWFEDEILTLLEYDFQEQYGNAFVNGKILNSVTKQLPSHSLSR